MKKLGKIAALIGTGILVISKFTFLRIILFIYRNILGLLRKIKNINFKKLNYLIFIKKYLPRIAVLILLITATTNNIFASTYNTDEYANRTLLSTLITSDEEQWSELIEEYSPTTPQSPIANYVQEEALQEVAINTPFAEDTEELTEISPDATSLVLINPEEDALAGENMVAQRQEKITYTVQSGDVLGKIAEQFNISVNTILWENNLTWNSTIRSGQQLTILPSSGVDHEVKSGDTISAIAKKYQTDADKIIEANKLADASDIQIGDLLFVPDGIQPTRVVSSYQPQTPQYVPPASNIDTGSKLLWPVLSHRITQYYSWSHHGLDIGDKTGNPIYAAEAGRVERAGWSNGYGYNVVINHGNGIKTIYGHSSKLLVQTGDVVARGETIALVGSTGWSTGPHLHFEVRVNDVTQNPLNYIR